MRLVGIHKDRLCPHCKRGRLRVFAVKRDQVRLGSYQRRGQCRCTINGKTSLGCGHSVYGVEEFVGVWWPTKEEKVTT